MGSTQSSDVLSKPWGMMSVWVHAQVDASDNALAQLPGGFSSAAALQTLNVSSNRLTAFPGALMAGLCSLTALNLSQNLIGGSLSEDISCLSRYSLVFFNT